MIEDGRLCCARCRAVVVARNRVEKLCKDRRLDVMCPLFNHAQAEVDVAQEATLVGLPERRTASQLPCPTDVVKQSCRKQEVGAQSWMELRSLATESRDSNGVLEKTSRVTVVTVSPSGRQSAQRGANLRIAHERADDRRQRGMRDLGREKLEEAVELVCVSTQRGRERGRIRILGRLDGTYLDLELPAEALHAPEDVNGIPLLEATVEQVDVVPHSRLDATARISQLECEIGSPSASTAPLLLRHCEYALDGAILAQVGDGRHVSSLWREGVGTLVRMADVKPFRAVRYSGAAGALADLVAPPYDTVDEAQRAQLFTRSPYNVIHVTLPESADEAGNLYREWLAEGILEQDDDQAAWLVVEDYVGPDGVARERRGVALSLAAEPYETGSVLPHERTHPRIREERLRLLRAIHVQPEPIFLLTDAWLDLEVPERAPDLEVDATRLWRLPALDVAALAESQLLIADGHHRYESAVDLGAELGSPGARIMALIVSVDDPGLHVFPTHRVFSHRPDLVGARDGVPCADLVQALALLAEESFARSAAVAYRRDSVELVLGLEGEFDVELVDGYGLDGIRYTPRTAEAAALVDGGDADVAFLLRAPRVEDVFAVARRGERMPPKSTYFFPKPLSGLLFHPVAS